MSGARATRRMLVAMAVWTVAGAAGAGEPDEAAEPRVGSAVASSVGAAPGVAGVDDIRRALEDAKVQSQSEIREAVDDLRRGAIEAGVPLGAVGADTIEGRERIEDDAAELGFYGRIYDQLTTVLTSQTSYRAARVAEERSQVDAALARVDIVNLAERKLSGSGGPEGGSDLAKFEDKKVLLEASGGLRTVVLRVGPVAVHVRSVSFRFPQASEAPGPVSVAVDRCTGRTLGPYSGCDVSIRWITPIGAVAWLYVGTVVADVVSVVAPESVGAPVLLSVAPGPELVNRIADLARIGSEPPEPAAAPAPESVELDAVAMARLENRIKLAVEAKFRELELGGRLSSGGAKPAARPDGDIPPPPPGVSVAGLPGSVPVRSGRTREKEAIDPFARGYPARVQVVMLVRDGSGRVRARLRVQALSMDADAAPETSDVRVVEGDRLEAGWTVSGIDPGGSRVRIEHEQLGAKLLYPIYRSGVAAQEEAPGAGIAGAGARASRRDARGAVPASGFKVDVTTR